MPAPAPPPKVNTGVFDPENVTRPSSMVILLALTLPSMVTALNPVIGYDAAASVAKEAFATGRTLRQVVLDRGLLDAATLDRLLDPSSMLGRH